MGSRSLLAAPLRAGALLAGVLLAVTSTASCTLDVSGAQPLPGEGGAGPTTSSGTGSPTGVSSSDATSTSTGGVTTGSTSTGGEGGGGGAGGDGGSSGGGGAGGGEGGGGPLEWLARVTGPDVQRVHDVVYDPAGDAIYVVGMVKGSAATLEGLDTSHAAVGEDAFIAKLTPDGTPLWMRGFGGTGNDVALSVAVSSGGRVFAAGYASGSDGDAGDLFIPEVTIVPASSWGWLLEIAAEDGEPLRGVAFGPVETSDPIDVAVTTDFAVATATCTSSCEGAIGRDIAFAALHLVSNARGPSLAPDDGDQRAGAIAAVPGTNDIVAAGQFATDSYDPSFADGASCPALSRLGGNEVFAARYTLSVALAPPACVWARALGSTGNDRVDDVHVELDGTTYLAARFQAVPPDETEVGPYAVKLAPDGALAWSSPLEPGQSGGEARAVTSDGTTVVAGGQKTATDDGYLTRLAELDGSAIDERVFTPGTSRTWGLTRAGTRWVAGGEHSGLTGFGGDLGDVDTDGIDGFVMSFTTP